MNRIAELQKLGQSLWYDNIQRRLIDNGYLAGLIDRGDIRGITSNPSIFNNAIGKTNDYDSDLLVAAQSGWENEEIYNHLVGEDIRKAADLFIPLYEVTQGGDGYVSLEVSPELANDTQGTIAEAKRLWEAIDRPNLMIKIPATKSGIIAVEETLSCGINVNVTLIFSLTRYEEVMEAYIRGLERRAETGLSVNRIASVASFFISRVDTKVDGLLQKITGEDGSRGVEATRLLGKAAIANAKLAYNRFQQVFWSPRFKKLQDLGARVQRPLWASTSTKNPAYSDVMYVDELIGPETINTLPPQTLDAYIDHGTPFVTLTENIEQANQSIMALEALGISMDQVTEELEAEGVKAFADAYQSLLKTIDDRSYRDKEKR